MRYLQTLGAILLIALSGCVSTGFPTPKEQEQLPLYHGRVGVPNPYKCRVMVKLDGVDIESLDSGLEAVLVLSPWIHRIALAEINSYEQWYYSSAELRVYYVKSD